MLEDLLFCYQGKALPPSIKINVLTCFVEKSKTKLSGCVYIFFRKREKQLNLGLVIVFILESKDQKKINIKFLEFVGFNRTLLVKLREKLIVKLTDIVLDYHDRLNNNNKKA